MKMYRLTIAAKEAGRGRHPVLSEQWLPTQVRTDEDFEAIHGLQVGETHTDADGDGWTRIADAT